MLVVSAFRESVGFTEILLLLPIHFSFERNNGCDCESVERQGCDLCTAVDS